MEKKFSIKKICKKHQVHFVSIDDISSKEGGPTVSQRCIPVKKLKTIMKKYKKGGKGKKDGVIYSSYWLKNTM